jgi:ribonuclease HI
MYYSIKTSTSSTNLAIETNIWNLFFDGSRSQEGARVGCILIDPKKHKTFISYQIEFECTNNTGQYEALVQGLKKAIDLKVKCLKVFGDCEIIVKQVKNSIHYLSPHIKGYQTRGMEINQIF